MALNFKAQQIEILTHKNSHVNVVRSCLETPEKKGREKGRQREQVRERREESEEQPFANCRTRRTTWRTRVFRARSSFVPRSPPLHAQPYPHPHPGPGSCPGPGPGLRHMILPNLICRSGPRALIM